MQGTASHAHTCTLLSLAFPLAWPHPHSHLLPLIIFYAHSCAFKICLPFHRPFSQNAELCPSLRTLVFCFPLR
ncbi:hypothetical protein F5148DRAFT_1217653 [Russula earlei]|uniref:Uncharacterized protein n=1 Tax=Russula earlei TaxID=71964 RepID=A0ACC0U4H0_9AGAM|nr:hypothetical protein F5148DRAFT_1217653 [Russula earlei]